MKLTDKRKLTIGSLDLSKVRLAIVTSRFNSDITSALTKGATESFLEHGCLPENLEHYEVPGAFELPVVAKIAAKSQNYDAILCLGAVIRGETAHFEYVSKAAIDGLVQVSIETEVPILNGVITADNEEQAKARSCADLNLGYEYMKSALETIEACQAARKNCFAKNSSI